MISMSLDTIKKVSVFTTFLLFPSYSFSEPGSYNQQLEGLIREPLYLDVTLSNGQPAILDAFVTRPAGQEHLPVALITHGTVGTAEFDRWTMNPNYLSSTAIAFARHGYAAVAVLREGYGYSSGAAEYRGDSCEVPNHEIAGMRDKKDILAALGRIKEYTWASPDEAILVGMSAGGFAVISAGSANTDGVKAVINFAGGRGAKDGKSVCDEPGLLKAFSEYGKSAKIPSLWLYAKNDHFFPPNFAKAFFAAYSQNNNLARLHIFPPFSDNGHVVMDSAPEYFWWPEVSFFLKDRGLPYKEILDIAQAQLSQPAYLNNEEGVKGFKDYLAAMQYEKAFAVSDDGAWGVSYRNRTAEDAAFNALKSCREHDKGKGKCDVYAINNEVVVKKHHES